jgi:hypothetical protein
MALGGAGDPDAERCNAIPDMDGLWMMMRPIVSDNISMKAIDIIFTLSHNS